MELVTCKLLIDANRQELIEHGSALFPCARYHCDFHEFYNDEIPWHWHEEIEIMLVESGTMKLQLNSKTYEVKPGEGVFINSNVLHSATILDKTDCKISSFVFHTKLLSGSMEGLFRQRFIKPLTSCNSLFGIVFNGSEEWHNDVLISIQQAFNAYDEGEYCYELLVREHLSHMWYLLMQKTKSKEDDNKLGYGQETLRIKEMLNFIHLHFGENISISQIAKSTNISERECLRCFQKTIGCAPIQYLLKYRISIAAQLLNTTEVPIIKICDETGFDSPSYFSKMFKRYMGSSPTNYRNGSNKMN